MSWPTNTIVLWHGTDAASAGRIVKGGVRPVTGRNSRVQSWDFGPGFYTTTRREQAAGWAERTAPRSRPPESPMLVRFEAPVFAFEAAPKMAFADGGGSAHLFWGLVCSCRSGVPHHHPVLGRDFAVVVGPVAADIYPQRGGRNLVPDADQISFHGPQGRKLINSWPRMAENP